MLNLIKLILLILIDIKIKFKQTNNYNIYLTYIKYIYLKILNL